jgi:type I restriction enzyme, S subunit
MTEKAGLVPKRRLKEFQNTQGWEVRNFAEMFDCSIPNNTLSRAELNYESGEIKNVHYGDILVKYGALTDVEKDEIPFITNGDFAKYKRHLLKNGDIIIADTAEDETVGKATEIVGISNDYVVSGLHTIVCRPKVETKEYYLGYYLNSSAYHRQLLPLMQGIKVLAISRSSLAKTNVSYPVSMEEQHKIGVYFKDLDNLISYQQRKIEKIEALKSAYLEEMFPTEGELEPKRRFVGYAKAWEERDFFENIKDTIDFRGRTPKKLGLDWSESGYLALSASNVKQGYIDYEADAHYGNQELYEKWMNGCELGKGQVLFTTEAPMGNVAQVPNDKGYILSQRTIAFVVNPNKITDDFLAVLLSSPKTFAALSAMSSGGTAKGVSQKTLSQLKVTIPTNIEEQEKIGSFFKNIDSLIFLHQSKLQKLQNLKKAYLSEMFI